MADDRKRPPKSVSSRLESFRDSGEGSEAKRSKHMHTPHSSSEEDGEIRAGQRGEDKRLLPSSQRHRIQQDHHHHSDDDRKRESGQPQRREGSDLLSRVGGVSRPLKSSRSLHHHRRDRHGNERSSDHSSHRHRSREHSKRTAHYRERRRTHRSDKQSSRDSPGQGLQDKDGVRGSSDREDLRKVLERRRREERHRISDVSSEGDLEQTERGQQLLERESVSSAEEMSDYDEDEMLSGESGGESSTQSMDKEPTVQTTEKGSRWFSRDSASENEEDDTEGQKPATEGKNVRHPIGGYSVKDEEMSESDEEEPSARLEKDLKEIDEDDDHESSPDQPNLPDYYPGIYGCRSVENYEWLNRIEEGTFGVVFRGKEKRTNEIVALKKLKMEKEKEGFPITSLREVCCLLKAKHPNIVHVREIVVGSNMDKIYIVMDFIEHDLKALMETMKQPFLVGEVKTLMLQLLSGVHHLHDNWILHRDLKTSNLLLSHKGILKIGDFGLARDYGSPLKPYTPIVVTLWYRSPELLLGEKVYSTAVDMWSVGCIFGELLLHKPLFQGKSEIDQLNKIFQEMGTPNEKIWPKYPELPHVKDYSFKEQPYLNLRKKLPISVLTNSGFDLINRFLTYDPEKRISAESALEHEYFKETPLPVDPSMFPTWPAKSENVRKGNRERSPSAPVGGAAFRKLADDDESSSFSLSSSSQGKAASGPGFTLKF